MTQTMNTSLFFKEALSDLKIDTNRKELLRSIAIFIADGIKEGKQVSINYICTHNSRRSQLAQVWSNFTANYFNFEVI